MAAWEVQLITGGRGYTDVVASIQRGHATRVTLKREDQKKVEFLSKSISSSKHSTNKATYMSLVKYSMKAMKEIARFSLRISSTLALILHFQTRLRVSSNVTFLARGAGR